MTLSFIPELRTERLILRAPRETDFPAMLAFNDSPRAAFIGGGSPRQHVWRGLLANIGLWALRGYGFYSIDDHQGEFLGRIGVICHDGWPEPELAWHVYEQAEGKGYAYEAAQAAKADYHARISPQPLISLIDPANHRSAALAIRMGAKAEGDFHLAGHDCIIYRHTGGQP
ncbi:GNAT family N-acetyltransferase [Neogemmobacter tilapiae]|uniref:Acetyltransferase n=1 Tax=Neogemmobacter tilapiae TaxID=875041 RepID=A0A918TTU5_9RHOB|nr:GNAT family N-acetyltransferase [Gemmobacter tilapiae]GHC63253.1 acetyltransferase [Gemmobacter tilapiae]